MSEENKETYGACRFCGQTSIVSEDELLHVVANILCDAEHAADFIATRNCSCEQAEAQRTHEMKLEAAGAWAENTFEKSPEKLQAVLCAIKAVSEHHFGRIAIKSGKYLYTFDTDGNNDIRVKIKFTDTSEETF